MNPTPQASEKLDAIRLMQFITKWKKQLIYIGIGSILISFVFTLPIFMKPMFKAQTIIYPVNIQTYSKETATEQMVQLLASEDVLIKLADAFNLYKHYNIDSAGAYPRFEMLKRLQENVSVSKTEYESIEISVIDENPITAAAMCDSILSFVDQKAISLVRFRATEVVNIVGKQMRDKKAEVDSLENAIKEIRTQYGITEFENMVEGFSREYYRAVGSGGANSKLESTRKNLEEKGGEYVFLKELLWKVRGEYITYKLSYEQALTDTKKEMKFHNVISKATPPERKDSPKRTLIMLMFTAGMMLFALLVMIYQEHFKNRFDKELNS